MREPVDHAHPKAKSLETADDVTSNETVSTKNCAELCSCHRVPSVTFRSSS